MSHDGGSTGHAAYSTVHSGHSGGHSGGWLGAHHTIGNADHAGDASYPGGSYTSPGSSPGRSFRPELVSGIRWVLTILAAWLIIGFIFT